MSCFHSTSASQFGDGRLQVRGELEAAGEHVALQLEATVDRTDEALELDAATTVDQRQLGMTWSPLGMARTPTALTVHACLLRAGWTRALSPARSVSMPSRSPDVPR